MTYLPTLTGSGDFTSNVPITYSSQLVPAGTYSITATGVTTSVGTFSKAIIGHLLTEDTIISFYEAGDVEHNYKASLVGTFTCSVPTTIYFTITMIFTSPGTVSVSADDYSFVITTN